MKNISVFIPGESTTVTFNKRIVTYASLLTAKEVTVFWNFENVTTDLDNGSFVIVKDPTDPSKDETKTINPGYYDFQQLKDRLESDKLKLSMNIHNNTCSIVNDTGYKVNLKKLGKLLGFPENHELTAGVSERSQNPVDVNHGLRYLTVECDFVDSSKNSWNGAESTVLAFLPITPETRLNSNCYVYERNNAWRRTKDGVVSKMTFTVKSNVPGLKVDTDILMDITLE